MRRIFWMIVILMISTVFATASNIGLVKAEELTLVSILQELGFTNIEESTVETFMPAGTYNITLYAEFAGYHESNNLSWYLVEVEDSEYNLIFSGPEGNYGYINPPLSKIFAVNGEFGLSFHSPEERYFTETSRNPDGIKHAKIYINLDDPDMYLIGFENTLGGGDADYNDMVISLEFISQPVEIAGVNWYIANTTSDKVLIYLDGAYATPLKVIVRGWDEDKTTEEGNFLSKMVSGGFDVIFNKNAFSYDGSETIVKDTATWLLNNGYDCVFLFGWSGGGVVVAYEVQKEYASTAYSAVVISSAPVDWDSFSDAPIFQSAHTAEKDKVATSLIEGESDPFYNNMTAYYSNTIVDKEWHTWNGGHNIFLNTCKDHPGEDVATATITWFNAEHPPNTPSQPSGPTTVYRNVWYTYSTSTTDPNGDDVRYEFEFSGPIPTVSFTTGWYASGQTGSITVQWWDSDPFGTYQIRVRAQDVYGQWSDWSSSLAVSLVEYHDVAVISVSYTLPYGATAVYPGWVIDVPVTVRNEGDYKETFDVTAHYDSVAIRTKTVRNLASGATRTLTFVWDTTGVSPGTAGLNYTIKAVADPVPSETDIADNTRVADDPLTVKYPGDVDGDGDVDGGDYYLFSGAYGTEYGEPGYNPNCDFDGDVDGADYYIFSGNYGHNVEGELLVPLPNLF